MQKYDVIQEGYNPDFPLKAVIWKQGEPIPEWLSDRAKIKSINEDGNPILETRTCISGEIEILNSEGREILAKLKTSDSFLLFSDTHPIISLTPHQLHLLYG